MHPSWGQTTTRPQSWELAVMVGNKEKDIGGMKGEFSPHWRYFQTIDIVKKKICVPWSFLCFDQLFRFYSDESQGLSIQCCVAFFHCYRHSMGLTPLSAGEGEGSESPASGCLPVTHLCWKEHLFPLPSDCLSTYPGLFEEDATTNNSHWSLRFMDRQCPKYLILRCVQVQFYSRKECFLNTGWILIKIK